MYTPRRKKIFWKYYHQKLSAYNFKLYFCIEDWFSWQWDSWTWNHEESFVDHAAEGAPDHLLSSPGRLHHLRQSTQGQEDSNSLLICNVASVGPAKGRGKKNLTVTDCTVTFWALRFYGKKLFFCGLWKIIKFVFRYAYQKIQNSLKHKTGPNEHISQIFSSKYNYISVTEHSFLDLNIFIH